MACLLSFHGDILLRNTDRGGDANYKFLHRENFMFGGRLKNSKPLFLLLIMKRPHENYLSGGSIVARASERKWQPQPTARRAGQGRQILRQPLPPNASNDMATGKLDGTVRYISIVEKTGEKASWAFSIILSSVPVRPVTLSPRASRMGPALRASR
jgi:hypothetical protein